ncbi:MAG: hypothetical protein ACRCX4_06020 [Bacteroidales bacterium]
MRKLNSFRITCIILLWFALAYLLIQGHGGFTPKVIFILIASGIVIFVPIYKYLRRGKNL